MKTESKTQLWRELALGEPLQELDEVRWNGQWEPVLCSFDGTATPTVTKGVRYRRRVSEADSLREQLAGAQEHAERLRAALETELSLCEKRLKGILSFLSLNAQYQEDRQGEVDSLRAQCARLKKALAAPSGQRSPWLPIESAPRDRRILLLRPGGFVVCGKWNDDKYSRNPKPYWGVDTHDYLADLRKNPPLGWMPLPSAPETIAQEGAG